MSASIQKKPTVLILIGLLTSFPMVGCSTLGARSATLVPTRYALDAGPYRIATNQPFSADRPEVRGLIDLERQVERTLQLETDASAAPIEVYILDDRATFNHFLKYYYPELPPRRAFFFAQGDRRVVYTFQGDRLDEDLRHEACHALLHGSVASLPLWLDEGLAEYFESPHEPGGANREHLSLLMSDEKEPWVPDLVRLEGLADVRQMSPRDYREAWAWVHFLLQGTPENRERLREYLSDLRTSAPDAAPLSQRFQQVEDPESTNRELLVHLRSLQPDRAGGSTTAMASKIRSQDAGGTDSTRVMQSSSAATNPRKERPITRRMIDLLAMPLRLFSGDASARSAGLR